MNEEELKILRHFIKKFANHRFRCEQMWQEEKVLGKLYKMVFHPMLDGPYYTISTDGWYARLDWAWGDDSENEVVGNRETFAKDLIMIKMAVQ